jgi:hypothetical protein
MKTKTRNIIILTILVIIASILSSLFNPLGIVRALIAGGFIGYAFYYLYTSKDSGAIKFLTFLCLMLITILIEWFIPILDFSEMFSGRESLDVDTSSGAKLLGAIRIGAYFIVMGLAYNVTKWMQSILKSKSSKARKGFSALVLLIVGIGGSTFASAIHTLELMPMTAISGMIYSFLIYLSFMEIVLSNPLLEEKTETESSEIK